MRRLLKTALRRAACISLAGGFALLAVEASSAQPAPKTGEGLQPEADYSRICKPAGRDAAERDWTAWHGEPVTIDPGSMLASAQRYVGGTSRVVRDRVVARRMLAYLVDKPFQQRAAAAYAYGRLLLDDEAGPVDAEKGVALIREAAASGVVEALLELGRLYERGDVVPRDLEQAASLFKQNALAGGADGAIELARLYRKGLVPSPSPEAADRLVGVAHSMLVAAIARGDCSGLRKIAAIYGDADSPLHDAALSLRWYEAAVRTNDVDAAMALANAYRYGIGAPVNLDRTLELLKMAAAEGSGSAMRASGEILLHERGDRAGAIAWLVRAAAAKDMEAFALLSDIYGGAFGGGADQAARRDLLERAASLPHVRSALLVDLSRLLRGGIGGPADAARADALLEQAAARGDLNALLERIGRHSSEAGSAEVADQLAALEKAAEAGTPNARRLYAEVFRCGIGTKIDRAKARDWLSRAAADGDVPSLRLLSQDKDFTPAIADRLALLEKAGALGDRKSMADLAIAYRYGLDGVLAADSAAAARWETLATAEGPNRTLAVVRIAGAKLARATTAEEAAAAIAALDEVAIRGDAVAALTLGRVLLEGRAGVVRADRPKAIGLLSRAAGASNSEAMYLLSMLRPDELKDSGRDAAGWLEASALAGYAPAIVAAVARAPNAEEAETWTRLLEAASLCDADVMIEAARAYGRSSDNERAQAWLARATTLGNASPATSYALGLAYREGIGGKPDLDAARAYFLRAVDGGHWRAARELGRLSFDEGVGSQGLSTAVGWFEKAVDLGADNAAVELIHRLNERGEPASPIMDRAILLLRRAAEAGETTAMRELALLYRRGRGVAVDLDLGAMWLKRAAEAGDAVAMREMARLYGAGAGVTLSLEESAKWLKLAAERGDRKAMLELASALRIGFGMPADEAAANRWAARAAALPKRD